MANKDEAHEISDTAGSTIAASANECLRSFQECLMQASTVHARELSIVEDQFARFSTWATAMGVFAPERASMDHRLRYALDVRNVVNGLLESLKYRVEICSGILQRMKQGMPSDFLDSQNEQLKQSFIHIGAEISRLNKISNTIRRATKEIQIQKANDFRITDDDGNDVEPLLFSIFEHHISDRFPNINDIIQQRLVRAMILRRKRILYRRHRQTAVHVPPQGSIAKVPVAMPAAQQRTPQIPIDTNAKVDNTEVLIGSAPTSAPSQVLSATTLDPQKFKIASSPSAVSASETVALGDHEVLVFPPAPNLMIKHKYEQFIDAKFKFQQLEKSDLEAMGESTCPFCLHALPAEIVLNKRKWEHHVKNDLDPYVCLFEDCNNQDVLFSRSDEWRSHMEQHCIFWRCSSHRNLGPFSTRDEYMTHVREAHNTNLSDAQLRALANRNSRKVTKLFSSCSLCGKDESAIEGPLESHITGHLRSLALKSLPIYQEELPGIAGNDEASIEASRQHSRSTTKNFIDDKDMLEARAEDLELVEQASLNNVRNFLGDPHIDLIQNPEAEWNASFYERLAYKRLSWVPESDHTFQSFLCKQKQETVTQPSSETDEADKLLMTGLDHNAEIEGSPANIDAPTSLVEDQLEETNKSKELLLDTWVPLQGEAVSVASASMDPLASTSQNQWKWWQKVLASVKTIGITGYSELASEHGLAQSYLKSRRIKEAIEKSERTVIIGRKTLDKEDQTRLILEHELARSYLEDRRIEEAITILETVVAIEKRTLSMKSPSRLASEHELASAYLDNGRIKEAIRILEHVVEVQKMTLNAKEYDRRASEHELARAYLGDKRIKDAIQLLEHVVEVEREILFEQDHDRLTTEHELARAYLEDNRNEQAIILLKHVVSVRNTVLQENDPMRRVSTDLLKKAYSVKT